MKIEVLFGFTLNVVMVLGNDASDAEAELAPHMSDWVHEFEKFSNVSLCAAVMAGLGAAWCQRRQRDRAGQPVVDGVDGVDDQGGEQAADLRQCQRDQGLGRNRSVGQWQRIALARAFLRGAPVVILDEPTAALDPRAEKDLFDRIRTLLAGRTVLLISHRFGSVRSAHRIYVLDGGRVVESGDHESLMALGGLHAELFTLQAASYLG